MDFGVELDPQKDLPRDYRRLPKLIGWVLVCLSAGFALGAAAAEMTVGRRLDGHVSEQDKSEAVFRKWLEQHERIERTQRKQLNALCLAVGAENCIVQEE